MSATLNAQLIDAVEDGREADVKWLIEAGASPVARKVVTLRAKVEDGRGGYDWKEDTVECESALVLAVLHGQVGLVRVLLEKGASVDGEVGWRLSNDCGGRNWTASEWQQYRWAGSYSFPSALAVAIGYGGKEAVLDGDTVECPDSDGQLEMSLRGGIVTLDHPTSWEECSVLFAVRPNLEIVRLLLAYGARVTGAELDAARKNPNQEFLHTLETHLRCPIPRPAPASSKPPPLELANAEHAKQVRELAARVAVAEFRAAAAEERARIAERKRVEAETNAAALQTCNSALEQEVSALRSLTSTLERDLASLKHDITALMQATATLRQENFLLRQQMA